MFKLWVFSMRINKQDKNMFGSMCQLALMDYQDELRILNTILYNNYKKIVVSFFIVETSIEVINITCASNYSKEDLL